MQSASGVGLGSSPTARYIIIRKQAPGVGGKLVADLRHQTSLSSLQTAEPVSLNITLEATHLVHVCPSYTAHKPPSI